MKGILNSKIKTIKQECDTYRKSIKPKGLTTRQELEFNRAFFMGAYICLLKVAEIASAVPSRKVNRFLDAIRDEVLDTIGYRHIVETFNQKEGKGYEWHTEFKDKDY